MLWLFAFVGVFTVAYLAERYLAWRPIFTRLFMVAAVLWILIVLAGGGGHSVEAALYPPAILIALYFAARWIWSGGAMFLRGGD